MALTDDTLQERIEERFEDMELSFSDELGELTVEVSASDYLAFCGALQERAHFQLDQLIDLCGVDYSEYGKEAGEVWTGRRYAVVLHLLSTRLNERLRVRVFAEDDEFPIVPSVIDIWKSVNWYEREAFDLFGIVFDGHPDLRRILTDYGFIGHPFRKDFPMVGNVEMRYDDLQKRVVYEPVSIEERVNTPRVVRKDNRYV
ncbi:MAG: NADH-quinone oxidoreductase subunit C [Gammaproteobacteria bacterium]|uniref:NADH-quinone oxidoreductase subunit C n=1 Tax=Candidatus Thiopontia autotrophica TaxID=2841688 RepID=A0A8J6TQN3_9GAMM|nr:NADH-quinone oxidoreductase subunit C [Candidatus Thiopontia autotrophica]MBL6969420.1 NADH-quinone oxidoreductase subunit C [Gammaproteobacteria bacterium]